MVMANRYQGYSLLAEVLGESAQDLHLIRLQEFIFLHDAIMSHPCKALDVQHRIVIRESKPY